MNSVLKKPKTALRIFITILGGVFFALCLILLLFNITHEYHIVSGASMEPTLNNGTVDGVFVSKIKPYNRGDIIVANKGETDQDGNDVFVIKRLIALGGDKIKIAVIDGRCRIVLIFNNSDDEVVIDEPYLNDYSVNSTLKDRFYAMVNNCNLTVDEQGFLTIPNDEVFYLGDNRQISNDCSAYGPKKTNLIVGKVDYIVYGNRNAYWQVIEQVFGG